MDTSSKNKIAEYLLFFYLAVFPLGQLLRYDLNFQGYRVTLLLTDFIVGFIFLFILLARFDLPKISKIIFSFLLAATFSLILSLIFLNSNKVFVGALYLLRFISYFGLLVLSWNLVKKITGFRNRLFKSLLLVSLMVAIFGWFQYFIFPDLRTLKDIGWDDHLYRLIGTFLDPAFTSIILVFGFLFSLATFLKEKRKFYLFLVILFLISVAFTYSRAGYLALLGGSLFIFYKAKKMGRFILLLATLLVLIINLPRPASEGAHLERSYSILSRLSNYSETFAIFKKSPLFGVGFNNLCLAREKYLGDVNVLSHSCSGSDSSVLLVLATTGCLGFFIFIKILIKIFNSVGDNLYGTAFNSSLIALLIHSQFSNSLFYPFVLGYMAILLGSALITQREN